MCYVGGVFFQGSVFEFYCLGLLVEVVYVDASVVRTDD